MLARKIIKNASGEIVTLNARERQLVKNLQRKHIENALGFQVDLTSLTSISKSVTDQRFFEIEPAEYIPMRVGGNSAWASSILTYRSYMLGDDFETGNINTGGNNGRLASADAGVDSLTVPVINWGKTIGWTLIELAQATRSGNWDLIEAKEAARLKNWQLGIQKIAFLGSATNASVLGLYTQAGVAVDTQTLPQSISSLSVTDLKAFCIAVLNVYRSNCNRTAWPTHFIIPESDYLGLAGPASAQFPIKSTLAQLEEMFTTMTKKSFKILPCAYGDHGTPGSGQTYQQYVLLNYDEKSLRMDIPVDFQNTMANSIDNFAFQSVAYGQYTGVLTYRPLEMYYFRFTP